MKAALAHSIDPASLVPVVDTFWDAESHTAAELRARLRQVLIDGHREWEGLPRRSAADVLEVVDALIAAVRHEERARVAP